MVNYRRARIQGGCYFFTLALHDRKKSLLTDHITELRQAFSGVKKSWPFEIDAMVVLPEHLHCIWMLPNGDDNYSLRWRQIKSAFSRQLPAGEKRNASRIAKRERGIWQRRFWEHTITDTDDYQRHVDYIHFNPVKHGCVRQVKDWPYSSFFRFVDKGVYEMNWAGELDDSELLAGE